MSTGKSEPVTPSPHAKGRDSVEKVAAKLPDAQDRSKQWSKDCIDRDNHRCVISGAITREAWLDGGHPEDCWNGKLEVHHIIPFIGKSGKEVLQSPAYHLPGSLPPLICDSMLTVLTGSA